MTAGFRALAAEHLSIRESDEITVAYDRRSGQTHLMTPDLAAVFEALRETPGDAATVVATLARTRDLEVGSGSVLEAVEGRLADLYALSFVEALTPGDPEP